ncbi:MAG: hypothetical protein IJL56_02450 [Bacteroidales bacterium]|nr:hypothetical protein [Bacteroidales bacterium]
MKERADIEKKYDAFVKDLSSTPRKSEDIRSYYEIIGVQHFLQPDGARELFTKPFGNFRKGIVDELVTESCRSNPYCAKIYDPRALEYELGDVISDLAFAQMERIPTVHGSKETDEREQGIAFVLSVYTVFAILENPALTAADFSRLFRRSWDNYFLNDISRAIRNVYDKNWYGKYNPRTTFYPLG